MLVLIAKDIAEDVSYLGWGLEYVEVKTILKYGTGPSKVRVHSL